MPKSASQPSLYGLENTNRDSADLWGKNQFNGTFPTALACYMRDQEINAIYLATDKHAGIAQREMAISEIFGVSPGTVNPRFDFETPYAQYEPFVDGRLERADLCVGQQTGNRIEQTRPLEIKLTVVPDNVTASRPPGEWAPEIVIRPSTTVYCALGLRHALTGRLDELVAIVEPACMSVRNWASESEAIESIERVADAFDELQRKFYEAQVPIVLNPIWRTEGTEPSLAKNAFDIFVWSNLGLFRVVTDRVRDGLATMRKKNRLSRHGRALLRFVRLLHELSRGRANVENIVAEMTYSYQSDKEFALSGAVTSKYMIHDRLEYPVVPREALAQIILNGGERNLSPERRFDATIYFTARAMFDAVSEGESSE